MRERERVVVIGGGSGMGLAVAQSALADGGEVVIVGRDAARLERARHALGGERVDVVAADIGDREQMTRLFTSVGTFDHLVVTAADLVYGPVLGLRETDVMRAVRSKLIGPMIAAQESVSRIRAGGSITYVSGIAARRPMRGGAMAAAVNSALEGLVRALAIELAPIRVNAVSPGWTDTPIWDTFPGMTEESKRERFATMATRLPVGRIGRVDDVAAAVIFVMRNGFATGSVVHVDGGHQLV